MLFDHIDTSRKYLLIGDTAHAPELDAHVFSFPFIMAATLLDYAALLVECHADEVARLPAYAEDANARIESMDEADRAAFLKSDMYGNPLINGAVLADQAGIDFVAADPRDRVRKKKYKRWTVSASAHAYNDHADKRATRFDDQLADSILSQQGKTIVFYGAGHFGKGRPLEERIPREDRVIVDIFLTRAERDAFAADAECADDALEYIVETDEILKPQYDPFQAAPKAPTGRICRPRLGLGT